MDSKNISLIILNRGETVFALTPVYCMVLILDGNLLHVAHAWRKIGIFGYPIYDCSRINEKPYTGQITEIAPYVRTYLWVTI